MELDLVYHVLDLQVLDVNGRRCGRVDDVEIDLEAGQATALLIGKGTYPERLPGERLRRLARRIVGPEVLGRDVIRVPWEEVDSIESTVRLERPADEMGLGQGDTALSPVVSRLLAVPERRPR